MRAGKLNQRVQLYKKSVSRTTRGNEDITWQLIDTVWGSVESPDGTEYIAGEREQTEVRTVIRIRYRKQLTAVDRAVVETRTYDIQSVPPDPDGKKRELILICKERG